MLALAKAAAPVAPAVTRREALPAKPIRRRPQTDMAPQRKCRQTFDKTLPLPI